VTDSEPSLKVEIRLFLKIAIPLAAAYLAEFAMFITTKMVVGKLGYQQLAAVGIAGDLSFETARASGCQHAWYSRYGLNLESGSGIAFDAPGPDGYRISDPLFARA